MSSTGANEVSDEQRSRLGRCVACGCCGMLCCAVQILSECNNWIFSDRRDRSRDREMEALGVLAVAERDILAHCVRSRVAVLPVRIEVLTTFAPRTARIEPAQATLFASLTERLRFARLSSPRSLRSRGHRQHASPFQSAREGSVWSATDRSASKRPVQPDFPWRTERARAGRVHVVASATPI